MMMPVVKSMAPVAAAASGEAERAAVVTWLRRRAERAREIAEAQRARGAMHYLGAHTIDRASRGLDEMADRIMAGDHQRESDA